MSQPQLQAGHWYLVAGDAGHGTIRAYMADGGWSPAHPTPTTVVCEMSREDHPDDVIIGDDITVTEWDHQVIEHFYPVAAAEPLVERAIRALAERICIASGEDWDVEWTIDPHLEPDIFTNRHIRFLAIAIDLFQQVGGDNPQIRPWSDVVQAAGQPEGIFRPRRWPAEPLPGAVQLSRAS